MIYAGDISIAVPPAEEPVTLAEAKAQVHYMGTAEDGVMVMQLQAAREQCELVARRAFVTQTLDLRMSAWPVAGVLPLPRPPLQEVLSVKYTTSDGAEHTLPGSSYVTYPTEPGRLVLVPAANWPSDELMPGPSITVRYVAGYGDADQVPLRYKHAILLLFGTWFLTREHVTIGSVAREMPDSVRALLLTDRG